MGAVVTFKRVVGVFTFVSALWLMPRTASGQMT